MAIKRSNSTDAPMPSLSSAVLQAYPPRTLWRDAWRRYRRHRLAMAGSLVLLTLILSILVGPVVYPRAINEIDFAVKLTNAPWEVEEEDRERLRRAGFNDRDIWDIASVAAFYNMTNRLASATDMRPNSVYHGQAR